MQDTMKELETDFIFTEADLAIYTKVSDVILALKNNREDLFPTIISHMGGFRIGMCMLCTIYSLFKRCGIVQLLSSAGLGGLGTVKKMLTGGDLKEGIQEVVQGTLMTKDQIYGCI